MLLSNVPLETLAIAVGSSTRLTTEIATLKFLLGLLADYVEGFLLDSR